MNKKIYFLIIAAICLMAFMSLTNPDQIPIVFLLMPFLAIGYILFLVFDYFINIFQGSRKRAAVLSVVLTVVIINFLILRSIGQLTFQDGLISVFITTILGFYISKFQLSN